MKRSRPIVYALLAATVLSAASAYALINPRFTPIHLTGQSRLILEVELKQGDAKDQYVAAIKTVIKGDTKQKELTLDLTKAVNRQHAEALRGLAAASKNEPALFFVGEYLEDQPAGGGFGGDGGFGAGDPFGGGRPVAPARKGLLHVRGQWAEFCGGEEGVWTLAQIDLHMQSVWAGGTDMLGRCVRYVLEDGDPDVPVNAGAAWDEQLKSFRKIDGRITALEAVDLDDRGRLALYVAGPSGDRLLACNPESRELLDLTTAKRLRSRSQAFAWGDFSGDGRLDLVSFDGQGFGLQVQQADGKFASRALELAHVLPRGCVGLAPLDSGGRGHSGLLVSTKTNPVLVAFDGDGPSGTTVLGTGKIEFDRLGRAGACLVADFDGDALPDVLQPFADGSLFYKGLALGEFRSAAPCSVRLGHGDAAACLADFDGDGRLDVFCVAEDASRIWQNEAAGRFSEHLGTSGEIAYISKPGGVDCMAGDLNNDGRQDALIVYKDIGAQVFFNRGFRSFGHAHLLDLTENQLLPEAETGQQAGCLGDFDGDGAQDMALALKNGEIWVFYRENEYEEAYSATVSLPANAGRRGPVTVTGWIEKRCLGAWNVVPGTGRAFFGLREPGPLTVKWTAPSGKPQEKEIIVEDKPVRLEIH